MAESITVGDAIAKLYNLVASMFKPVSAQYANREHFTAGQVSINASTPVRVVPANINRRSLVLKNLGTSNIFYGPDQSVSINNGGLMLPLDTVILENNSSAVWAISFSGAQTISFVQE
jgi:hypothetical protein